MSVSQAGYDAAMAELAYRLLSEAEVAEGLRSLSGWSVEGGQITRTFAFDAYQKGLVFAATVGYLADTLNHHPDLFIGYGKVRVAMNTHDVGGLSPYDLELARRIEAVAPA